jgi:hypothetical protein
LPIKREIIAADFRDRVIHHFLYNRIYPIFDRKFIYDCYSCRVGKGTLFGIKRARGFLRSCGAKVGGGAGWWSLGLSAFPYFRPGVSVIPGLFYFAFVPQIYLLRQSQFIIFYIDDTEKRIR